MKIAVDAGVISDGGGISRYVGCMLETMLSRLPKEEWLFYGRGRRLRTLGRAMNVRIRSDGLPGNAGRIASLFSTLPLWSAIDHPDVYWGPAHRLPLRLPQSTAKVVTIHDLCWLKAPGSMRGVTRRLDAYFMPRAIAMADRVIAVSAETAHDLRQAYPGVADKLHLVPLGVTALPSPLAREALDRLQVQVPYVLFVGTQEPRKNLERLLQAFAQLRQTLAPCPQMVIAGGLGWGGVDLHKRCQQLGLEEKVKVLGRVDDAMLSTLYRHAQFLAMPSLYEGFGLPLVEAMAQGLPVLTSNVSSMPGVAGPAGLLVDPFSVQSIADGLARLVNDQMFRTQLGTHAIAQAQKFSWSHAARITLNIMQSAYETNKRRLG